MAVPKPKIKQLKLKATNSDLKDRIVSSLKRIAPRKEGSGSIEVCRTNRDILSRVRYVLTTGLDVFDTVTGGLPFGRVVEIYGLESCLAGDTQVHYHSIGQQQGYRPSIYGTIESLHRAFHDPALTRDFFVTSIGEGKQVIKNRVCDVVATGTKDCFEVVTQRGYKLKSTLDHKFLGGDGEYRPLAELKVGDGVVVVQDSFVEYDDIASIVPCGQHQTYDIKCLAPNNNYVANGIIVHNCGKTALVMRSAVRAQKREIYERIRDEDDGSTSLVKVPDDTDVTVLYVDNEQSLEDDEKIVIEGVEIDAVLARCDTVELLFKVIDKTLDDISAFETETGRKQFVVVIVDTIAGTSSKEEMTQDWGKDDYSRQPKQLRKAFRRITRKINRQNVCMLCTNQVSDSYQVQSAGGGGKSNLPRDQDFSTFGGRALKYYATVRIFMFKMQYKYTLVKGAQFAAGFLVGFFTSKNRQVKPLREGRLALLFDCGLNNEFSTLESLLFYDFATVIEETKEIAFRFAAWNIQTTTFDGNNSVIEDDAPAVIDLDDDEDEAPARGKKVKKPKNPRIENRAQWPAFYAAHKSDFDLMWKAVQRYIFVTEGLGGFVPEKDDQAHDDGPDE